ncbi:sulfate ABC transporter permease subunit CysT [Paenalcaligenes niemegkensis]|uniref:sulfate ABC transporter permease subunit CysT n=1 Tax=Paenalcaligenes niemegkensis TaxID=2895469 RepID=UPI001EE7BDAF|nr:sulfate ABC transporter permease subunit CysT [Paenalcaligenes niemegkensis]MCQ9616121.1 sulfate ABC transporter permease subunit CysT [Paenalcaligenes niemegkensis]
MSLALLRGWRRPGPLPGFGLTLGFTISYLCLLILIPLAAVLLKASELTLAQMWQIATSERVLLSLRLSFGMALLAALINAVFGSVLAWVLVRYRFPGRRFIDALIDLPFALPTAVAGIALAAIYAPNGWVGQWFDMRIAFTPLGILIALSFIGLPFVVRTVQPVLQDLEREQEEVAACLGATRLQTVWHVVFPTLLPALLTGVALAFARAVGEYGSVIFIAGNIPMVSEITPLLIVTRLEQFDYAGAAVLAAIMLLISFFILLGINSLQWWLQNRHQARGAAEALPAGSLEAA